MLRIANETSAYVLDEIVGLDVRAAEGILSTRPAHGFRSLAELDAAPYVGKAAFSTLLDYASSVGLVAPSAALCVWDSGYDELEGVSMYLTAPFEHSDHMSATEWTPYLMSDDDWLGERLECTPHYGVDDRYSCHVWVPVDSPLGNGFHDLRYAFDFNGALVGTQSAFSLSTYSAVEDGRYDYPVRVETATQAQWRCSDAKTH